MATPLTGTNGLFTRLGKVFYVVDQILTHQTTLETEIEDVMDEYDGTNEGWEMLQQLSGSIETSQISAAAPFSALFAVVSQTIIDMVNDDDPLPSLDIYQAVERLIEQMGTGNDVDGSTTACSVGAVSGTGNGTVVYCVDNLDGNNFQYLRPEDVVFECIRDNKDGKSTDGRESFTIKGEVAYTDPKHPSWPGGSGVSSTIRVTDPSENSQTAVGRNLLYNSDFEDFTVANTPDRWDIITGAYGTDVFEEGTTVYRGSKSLEFLGDGSTNIEMRQAFNSGGGSTSKLKPYTRYGVSCRVTADTGVVAGTIHITLAADGRNNEDPDSTKLSIDCTGVSTGGTWDHEWTTFRTPRNMTNGLYLYIYFFSALTNTKHVWLDDLCFFEMQQFSGAGGPYFSVITGSTYFVIKDKIIATVTNDYAGEMQKHMDRSLGMYSMGLQIPFQTDGSETVDDALIA